MDIISDFFKYKLYLYDYKKFKEQYGTYNLFYLEKCMTKNFYKLNNALK